ncbi:hypothetical protein AJ79_01763 [Helicocarpus griseus UAMH5409]|uniref:Uncharacterized protein n=1 Tax=Helicocarpus griseus UAMH5409 TaxID=1447875 RepID=A0A2B7Y6C7_9EURO|nr:hypothetical protein AJ79_01763 [Helicocarpus griseus UAMH5409]
MNGQGDQTSCNSTQTLPDDEKETVQCIAPSVKDRNDFEVAIICALPLEASAVAALFDKKYDEKAYGKVPGDSNSYSVGVIGRHNVVLVHMPNMGKVAAAAASVFLCASFQRIQLALIVGICGGVPFGGHARKDIFLGDVVISEGLVQYDFGRRLPGNRFLRKDTPQDNLPRPRPEVRAVLAKLKTEQGRSLLQNKTSEYLRQLRSKLGSSIRYPGAKEDRLFKSTHRHKHHDLLKCAKCAEDETNDPCDEATQMDCKELRCHDQEPMLRTRLSLRTTPITHFGLVASGDTVLKSGEDRDAIASRDDVIAFEMEGAGVWEIFPAVLVIKGVCDYADSHKNKRWQRYAAATAAAVTKCFLENWVPVFFGVLSPRVETWLPEKDPALKAREAGVLKKLDKLAYRDRKDRNPDRIPGTCEWFINHELFRDWKESNSSKMLWVSADPGCGKSVLAKYLADSALASAGNRTTGYFFFKDDSEEQRSVVTALCCILRQIFLQRRFLLSEAIIEKFETDGGTLTSSFGDLWDVLIRTAEDKHAGEIICILDAIDECGDQGRSQLTQALCKLYSTSRDFKLKFLLTSRPYSEIRREFQHLDVSGLPVIHLSGESEVEMEKISKEIDIVIKARVKDICAKLRLKDDEKEILLQELMRVPNRTYLWVRLTLDVVEGDIDISKNRITEIARNLPKTLDDAYEGILSKSRNVNEAKRLLHIIVAAARPLTLKEMNVALTIGENHRSYADLELKSEDRFRETIRDFCGLFVCIIGSHIYLLHQTAREFLIRRAAEGLTEISNGNNKWKNSLDQRESHRILLDICIRHLLFTEFETDSPDILNEDNIYSEKILTILSQYTDDHIFFGYSAKYWPSHFHESNTEADAMTPSLLKLCDVNSNRSFNWFRIYWMGGRTYLPQGFTTLMIASYCGLKRVVELLLENSDVDLNARDSMYRASALSRAAENGFDEVAKLLIKGTKRSLGGIIKIPLRKGAQIDLLDGYGRTPLSLASMGGHVAVAKLLLKSGARIDVRDENGLTPLAWAAYEGHEAVAKLLVEHGAELESRDENNQTPLSLAADEQKETVVKMLLDKGANLENKDDFSFTPLLHAANCGNGFLVKLLVERNADLKVRDSQGRTALSLAAKRGYKTVVKLLIQEGADIESKDDSRHTPLWLAAEYGQEAVVKLLLDNGADIESKDTDGRTPLSIAVDKRQKATVKLLLDHGARFFQ